MFVNACLVNEETGFWTTNALAVGGHLCPYCGVIGITGLTALRGDFSWIYKDDDEDNDNFGMEGSYEMFLCDACGAIMVLQMANDMSKLDRKEDDTPDTRWDRFLVKEEEADPALVAAMKAKYLTHDQFEPLTWVKIPAWKIRCARGASRSSGANWVGVPGRNADADADEGNESDATPDDVNEETATPVLMCDSYSLTHPAVPYPKSLEFCKDHFLPDVLGSYVVHLFLVAPGPEGRTTAAAFCGHEGDRISCWEKAALSRLGMPARDEDSE
jgi:hypothetical protein